MESFKCGHEDAIRDVEYDYYGKRVATCSSDHQIKIYEKDENGSWIKVQEIKHHSASVQRVAWSRPEFGPILASSSTDLFVQIYVETDKGPNERVWKLKAKLVDSVCAVTDIAFAPLAQGLRLATCSRDGFVRVYEAMDVMNLSSWSLVEQFRADEKDCHCIDWNESPFDPYQIVVGTRNSAKIWEYSNDYKRWQSVCLLDGHTEDIYDVVWAPKMGRKYHLIATGCKDGIVRIFKISSKGEFTVNLVAELNQHQSPVWRVSWNVTGTILASSGSDGTVRLWKADSEDNWRQIMVAGSGSALQKESERNRKSLLSD
uniref:Nuclear pore complex component n=1 Tax=Hirondellea gigas TaxID=1518452 RepID=A0A6A7GD02_9CRUS